MYGALTVVQIYASPLATSLVLFDRRDYEAIQQTLQTR
jgi:hypothetical protein